MKIYDVVRGKYLIFSAMLLRSAAEKRLSCNQQKLKQQTQEGHDQSCLLETRIVKANIQ